ncbi:GvpL/GvpF family gas vesicle protein [Amycolatopsis acidicola]|uniref:GvpL/GvpF family gas vesicle protein n=1 Tax=Amycolatopsis acidicola TaxID=2596893 RepID=A0A5N0V3C0_9PSEU|nr:GvpL/GvpF family gas vesicle protein [Amycolatopsis acidicola]KAA9159291.1 GvpL/GvpF family gas vesicle protein [Amycolatopsis acidicola]
MGEETGIWLYAVTRALDPAVFAQLPGVAGERVRTLGAHGLAAVVGDVPMDSFGEEPLHRNLEDLDWLSTVARAHDAVIGAVVERGPAVPIRLATVYRDDDRVREVLDLRGAEFERTLEFVAGRAEWGVKAYLEEPEPGDSGAAPSRRGAGTAYLARRRAEQASRTRAEELAHEQVLSVHTRLTGLAAGARTHPPQSRALAGHGGRMLLNAAYLVEDSAARGFAEAVARCDDENAAIRLQLTGPWPPYSFASLEKA